MMLHPPITLAAAPSWRAKAFLLALTQAKPHEKEWVRDAAAKLSKEDWEQSIFSFSGLQSVHPKNESMQTFLKKIENVDLNHGAAEAISANLAQWATWLLASDGDKWKILKHTKQLECISVLKIRYSQQVIYLKGEEARPLFDKSAPRTTPYVLWQWSWGGLIRDNDKPPSGVVEQMMIGNVFKANRERYDGSSFARKNRMLLEDIGQMKRYWSVLPVYEAFGLFWIACKEVIDIPDPEIKKEQMNKLKELCYQRGASNVLKMVSADELSAKSLALNCAASPYYRENLTKAGLLPVEEAISLMIYPELKGKGFVSSFGLTFNKNCYLENFLEHFSNYDLKIILQRWLEETSHIKIIDFLNAHKKRLTPEVLSEVNSEKTTPLFSILKSKLQPPEKIQVLRAFLDAGTDPTVATDRGNIIEYAEKFSTHGIYLPILKEYALRSVAGESVQSRPKIKV